MAARRSKDISEVVSRFATEIENMVRSRVDQEFASRFDELKDSILKGNRRAPRAGAARKLGGVGTGKPAELVPCPVTGEANKGRRFSYLMPEARTAENLKKFRGWHRKSADEMRKLGVIPSAIEAMTGDRNAPAASAAKGKKASKKKAKK